MDKTRSEPPTIHTRRDHDDRQSKRTTINTARITDTMRRTPPVDTSANRELPINQPRMQRPANVTTSLNHPRIRSRVVTSRSRLDVSMRSMVHSNVRVDERGSPQPASYPTHC